MSQPLVSISCVSFNHAPFLKECFEGFLIQKTNFTFEILVYDDASTDGSQKIIEEYTLKYPELFFPIYQVENQFSKGVRAIMTRFNFSRARGKYIAPCEGDDFWTDPFKLQKQVDFLEANPECILTGHDAKIVDKNSQVVNESKLPDYQKRDADSEELKLGFWILTLSMVFRNNEIFKNYPEEGYNSKNGDTFLVSLLGQFGWFHYMPEILPAAYRVHDGGVWSTKSNAHKDFNAMTTKFYMSEYYKKKKDPIATKIYTSAVSKGISLFNEQRKELDQFDKNQKKQYLKMMTKSHLQVYGWLKSIKFIINKYAWYYLKN